MKTLFPVRAGVLAILALGACVNQARAQVLNIAVAPLAVIDGQSRPLERLARFDEDLLDALRSIPASGCIEFSRAREADTAIASLLDAARLCERGRYPYLLYGYLRYSEGLLYSELKLISRDGKRVVATFAAADDGTHYRRLVDDVAAKIVRRLADDLGLPDGDRKAASRNVLELPVSLGYWAPAGEWADPIAGVFRAELGFRLIPKEPLGAIGSRPWSLAAAPRLEYALGMNRPGYETSFLQRITARFPIEAAVGLGTGDLVRVSAGFLVDFDILSQERKYGKRQVESVVAGGLCASAAYYRGLGERLRVGLSCGLDVVLHDTPLFAFTPSLAMDIRLGGTHD